MTYLDSVKAFVVGSITEREFVEQHWRHVDDVYAEPYWSRVEGCRADVDCGYAPREELRMAIIGELMRPWPHVETGTTQNCGVSYHLVCHAR